MGNTSLAVIGFGSLCLVAIVMFVLERRAVAARKAARGGREVDVSDLIAFGAPGAKARQERDD